VIQFVYPGWSETFGTVWDVITDNLLEGKKELTYPETLPMLCNMCQLPIASVPGPTWKVRDFPLDYKGRSYHFCSEGCQWCFEQKPERYAGHLSLIDRFLAGHIQPPNLEGALNYMGLAPGEIGDDAHNYAWVEKIRAARQKAAA
jgi:toluene monooxygenase system protein A